MRTFKLALGTLLLVSPSAALAQPAVGSEFQVNSYTTNSQRRPSVAVDPDGDFVVVWHGYGSGDNDSSIHGQRYASDGTQRGSEFQINTYTTSGQSLPSVDVDSDGDFVVVWQSDGSSGSDNHLLSIQAQRYLNRIFIDGFESGNTSAWSATVGAP